MDERTEHNLRPIFNQYLQTTMVPILDYKIRQKRKGITLKYKWSDIVEGFNMPVVIRTNKGDTKKLFPKPEYQKVFVKGASDISFATDLHYFQTMKR